MTGLRNWYIVLWKDCRVVQAPEASHTVFLIVNCAFSAVWLQPFECVNPACWSCTVHARLVPSFHLTYGGGRRFIDRCVLRGCRGKQGWGFGDSVTAFEDIAGDDSSFAHWWRSLVLRVQRWREHQWSSPGAYLSNSSSDSPSSECIAPIPSVRLQLCEKYRCTNTPFTQSNSSGSQSSSEGSYILGFKLRCNSQQQQQEQTLIRNIRHLCFAVREHSFFTATTLLRAQNPDSFQQRLWMISPALRFTSNHAPPSLSALRNSLT